MELDVHGHRAYACTGGRPFDAALPTIVFIHGVLNDHSVWHHPARWFAQHGWNALAVDLPGHGLSAGEPPASVEEAAGFILALLEAAGVRRVALAGHSFGSLIALEAAARAPAHITISHLALLGTAFPMKVSPALLDTAANDPQRAIAMVNTYSHSMPVQAPAALGPGIWLYDRLHALMCRVLARNPRTNVLHTGFKACDSYAQGLATMAAVRCPVLFVLGQADRMTPVRAAQELIERAANARVVTVNAGHALMREAPGELSAALAEFTNAC